MNIFEVICKKFERGMIIPLIRKGRYYIFIEVSETIVNKKRFKAIHYQISEINSKKITSVFIELTYEYYLKHKTFPDRDWYRNHKLLKYEYKSRPCNYSVAQGLINSVI